MALFEVIKYEGNDEDFVWKFPSDNLKLGSQLIVNYSQSAFFVKNGQILDEFNEGRHTIASTNLPILSKIINRQFGGVSPFPAEVWFVNNICKLDNKWGTASPINLEDPIYKIIIPVRAHGQFGFKILDAKSFLKSIVGNVKLFTAKDITSYFTGKILNSITTIISKKIVIDKISLLQIGVFQDMLSEFCQQEINKEVVKYGIEIVNFFFISINIPEEDPSFIKLKESKALAMHVNVVGKDIYQTDKTFDVLLGAVNNKGNSSTIMESGIGLGVGLGIAGVIGNQLSNLNRNINNLNNNPPPLPLSNVYFFVIDGKQSEGLTIERIKELIINKIIDENTLSWKQGLAEWVNAKDIEELNHLLVSH